jgi:hypothetical protein
MVYYFSLNKTSNTFHWMKNTSPICFGCLYSSLHINISVSFCPVLQRGARNQICGLFGRKLKQKVHVRDSASAY